MLAKFAVISSLVVLAVRLPYLIRRSGTWRGEEVVTIQQSNDSNEIVSLKRKLKDAEATIEFSTAALQALAMLRKDAGQDERREWVQRYSLVMKDTIYEIGGRVCEVEPQYFDPKFIRKGQLSLLNFLY
jgi:hypothetical protein